MMHKPRRIGRALIGVFVLVVIPGAVLSFCMGSPWYYADKFSAAGPARPMAQPAEIVPERQVEPHTCGLHSLSSLYRAYGLEAEALRLRFRLGVDKPLNNFVPNSRGTIHPDMLRVLSQDGFLTTVVRPSSADASDRVSRHLAEGHFAVALTKVSEFHWVVLAAGPELSQGRVEVCDSLHERKYLEPFEEYMTDQVYSILLVKPQ